MKQRFVLGMAAAALCLGFAADDETKLLPAGAGKNAIVIVCMECHGTGRFRKYRKNKDDWSETVQDMVDRGAKGTEAELAAVLDYLVQNFGPDSRVNMNTAPFEEVKVVLNFTVPETTAVIEYRQKNGNFKEWQDLLKVPGMDPQRVEVKKDLMAF